MASILLIDDDDQLRGVIRLALVTLGHEVTEARDGREGLAAFHRHPADLVITDIVMPDKEGLETIMELRQKHGAKKIIAMSGGGRMAAVEYLHIARQMGARRVLEKPFTNEVLTEAVNEVLAAQ